MERTRYAKVSWEGLWEDEDPFCRSWEETVVCLSRVDGECSGMDIVGTLDWGPGQVCASLFGLLLHFYDGPASTCSHASRAYNVTSHLCSFCVCISVIPYIHSTLLVLSICNVLCELC